MEDLVDILMTVYNTEIKYLKEQIDSILKQTHKNIKIYISDDASKNEEVKRILKEYEQKDNRIILFFQKENLGYNKNFEFLLKQSTAKYIMFSDHDDIWYETKVEKSLKTIKEKNMSLVYCNCRQVNENGEVLNQDYFKYKNVPLVEGKSKKIAISRCIGIGCSQIITKEVKEKMIPYKKEVIAHDWLASFIANEIDGISYIYEPLFDYRLHTNNVFGGRSFAQNANRWQEKNGTDYISYLKYRNEYVIDKAYLNGAKMCLIYSTEEKDIRFINKEIIYYENLKKSKYINFHIIKYFKILGGKNIGKKYVRELIVFHLPVLGYCIFKRKGRSK